MISTSICGLWKNPLSRRQYLYQSESVQCRIPVPTDENKSRTQNVFKTTAIKDQFINHRIFAWDQNKPVEVFTRIRHMLRLFIESGQNHLMKFSKPHRWPFQPLSAADGLFHSTRLRKARKDHGAEMAIKTEELFSSDWTGREQLIEIGIEIQYFIGFHCITFRMKAAFPELYASC